MLKGIDPLLDADILYILRAMGHGDVLAMVDTNFPAVSVAKTCTLTGVPKMGAPLPRAVEAVLSVMPLEAAARMEVIGAPDEVPPVQGEVEAVIGSAAPDALPVRGIERFAFYEEARRSFAVIQVFERRFYGCLLLTKGVVPPDA